MTHEEWEAICDKCGKCCYEKVDLGGGHIYYTDQPCEHLDTETNLCKFYDKRHEIEADCISLTEELVKTLDWLPEECAYARHFKYKDTLEAVRAVERNRQGRSRSRRRR